MLEFFVLQKIFLSLLLVNLLLLLFNGLCSRCPFDDMGMDMWSGQILYLDKSKYIFWSFGFHKIILIQFLHLKPSYWRKTFFSFICWDNLSGLLGLQRVLRVNIGRGISEHSTNHTLLAFPLIIRVRNMVR